MMRRVLFAGLLLCACQPQPQEAAAPTPQPEQAQPASPDAAALAADELPAPAGEIIVSGPAPGARVTSPLTVEGSVINNWMFEGVFQVELVADGEVIALAPGQQQAPDNWTNPGPVKFKAVLSFDVTKETPAVVILKEDMPKPKSPDSDEPGPARTLRIPVILTPPAK